VEELIASIFRGLGQGSVYALLAVGFVIIYRATDVVNFAQPALMVSAPTSPRVRQRSGCRSGSACSRRCSRWR
jgi:hypothetical protein